MIPRHLIDELAGPKNAVQTTLDRAVFFENDNRTSPLRVPVSTGIPGTPEARSLNRAMERSRSFPPSWLPSVVQIQLAKSGLQFT